MMGIQLKKTSLEAKGSGSPSPDPGRLTLTVHLSTLSKTGWRD